MKRNIFHIVLTAAFLLSACGGNAAPPTPTNVSVMDSSTATPSLLPTSTRMTQPAATLTVSITPLPTIPTFTPTFDARTIVTVTPASPTECPERNANLIPNFKIPTKNDRIFIGTDNEILNFLNQGGTLQSVLARLGKNGDPVIQDLTGDTTPEFAFIDFGIMSKLHIFMCTNGVFELFSPAPSSHGDFYSNRIEAIKDMNGDGLKDIVTSQRGCSGSGCFKISVFSWEGTNFIDLAPQLTPAGLLDIRFVDTNEDGLLDISLRGGLSGGCCMPGEYPRRVFTDIYSWNGNTFDYSATQYDPPIFRFQAIQDADRYSLNSGHDKALKLYQDAIFSDKLEWWSKQRAEFTRQAFLVSPPSWPNTIPPLMDPIPADINFEYNSLAAYAYYRIMLLHIVRGYESDAGTIYNTLQQKFGADLNGRPYAEMATAFWDTYQSTHKLYDGCAAAIQYATIHREILIPLGSNYHGSQSHTYVPADVCPFR